MQLPLYLIPSFVFYGKSKSQVKVGYVLRVEVPIPPYYEQSIGVLEYERRIIIRKPAIANFNKELSVEKKSITTMFFIK